jgi:transposase
LIASLSLDGIEAPMLLEGAVDGRAFHAYVQQVLVPTLRPGELVLLDNLSVHKQPAIRAMIESAGCRLLHLPSYSPDFNPIEQSPTSRTSFQSAATTAEAGSSGPARAAA